MKIIKTIYDHRYSAGEIVASLKNHFSSIFWSLNTAKNQEAYYEVNRKISGLLDDMVECQIVEFRVSREMINHLSSDRVIDMVKSRIAGEIANELVKNDKIILVLRENMQGDFVYSASIPFLKKEYTHDEN